MTDNCPGRNESPLTNTTAGTQNPKLKKVVKRLDEFIAESVRKNLTGTATVEIHFRHGEFVRVTMTLPETIE